MIKYDRGVKKTYCEILHNYMGKLKKYHCHNSINKNINTEIDLM